MIPQVFGEGPRLGAIAYVVHPMSSPCVYDLSPRLLSNCWYEHGYSALGTGVRPVSSFAKTGRAENVTTLGTYRHVLIVEGIETDVAGLERLDVLEEVVLAG